MSFRNSIFAMLPLVISAQALATVDALFTQNVIAQGIQSRQLCFVKVPMIGEFGIPEATMARMVFEPIYIAKISSSRPTQSVNINEITKQGRMTYSFDFNQPVEAGLTQLSMTVNLTALTSANGLSVDGRTMTIKTAKLVLLSLNKNLNELSRGKYKLKLNFIGLPDQTAIAGERVYAQTRYAYSASSPLIAAYTSELISDYCE